jgi:hypothetical protein
MRKLKTTVYARMEEMSFRSGAATGAGALAAVGIAIALAVTLTGHSAAATSEPGPTAPARSAAPVLPSVTPSVSPSTPSSRPAKSASPTAPPRGYLPATTPQRIRPEVPVPADTHLGPPQRPKRRLPNPILGATPPPVSVPPGWPL